MSKTDLVKIIISLMILFMLTRLNMTLDAIYEDRIIRVTEVNSYEVDIASHGNLTVPTEIDYPSKEE